MFHFWVKKITLMKKITMECGMKGIAISGLRKTLALPNIAAPIYRKLQDILRELCRDQRSRRIIAVIFVINLSFIAAHCFIQIALYFVLIEEFILHLRLNSWRFRLDRDGSVAEWFNYLQATICVVLLLGVFRTTRQPLYAAWALIFLVVVVDDSLTIHERAASYVASTFGIPAVSYLRPQDLGELLFWATIGSVLVGILWWSFARSGRSARDAGGVLALAFAALIFFAIGIDMIHMALSQQGTGLYAVLAVLEDGGEMLSIGLASALALLLYRHPAIAG